jgi:GWxTD domain-containing protein
MLPLRLLKRGAGLALLAVVLLPITALSAQRPTRADERAFGRSVTAVLTQLAVYEHHAYHRLPDFPGADTLRSVQQLVDQRVFPEYRPILDPSDDDLFWGITLLLGQTRDVPLSAAGRTAYDTADSLSLDLLARWPDEPRVVAARAAVLITRTRWAELEALGTARRASHPDDATGWMALGLAQARQRQAAAAAASLDTMLQRLPADERARLDRIERVLSPQVARLMTRTDSVGRAATTQAMWLQADPLWSSPEEDPRMEFLARVAQAELRWPDAGEDGRRGADSDRGRLLVRYGPPDVIARLDARAAGGRPAVGGVAVFWVYESGLVFAFTGAPRQPRLRMAFEDAAIVQAVAERMPARWDAIATRRIDSLPVQLARFRAQGDSVELFVAARADLARLSGVRAEPPQGRLWLIGEAGMDADGLPLRVGPDGSAAWAARVPAGSYRWRVELLPEGEGAAARASAPIVLGDDPLTGFLRRGFGMSDVLVGLAPPEAMAVDAPLPARWRDAAVQPLAGALGPARERVTLVWETYELAAREGSVAATVTVTLRREDTRRARRDQPPQDLDATVVGPLASTAGVRAGRDALTVSYELRGAATALRTDQLTLDLRRVPPGTYRLTVAVRDGHSGRATARETALRIEEPTAR